MNDRCRVLLSGGELNCQLEGNSKTHTDINNLNKFMSRVSFDQSLITGIYWPISARSCDAYVSMPCCPDEITITLATEEYSYREQNSQGQSVEIIGTLAETFYSEI